MLEILPARTPEDMVQARALFRETGLYSPAPTPGALFFELSLS